MQQKETNYFYSKFFYFFFLIILHFLYIGRENYMLNLTSVFSTFEESNKITYNSHIRSQFKVHKNYFFATDGENKLQILSN